MTLDVKFCTFCNDWTWQDWKVDREIPEEPIFTLICQSCGNENHSEPPIQFKSKSLPEGQRTL